MAQAKRVRLLCLKASDSEIGLPVGVLEKGVVIPSRAQLASRTRLDSHSANKVIVFAHRQKNA